MKRWQEGESCLGYFWVSTGRLGFQYLNVRSVESAQMLFFKWKVLVLTRLRKLKVNYSQNSHPYSIIEMLELLFSLERVSHEDLDREPNRLFGTNKVGL
jgi:hypothetical protein